MLTAACMAGVLAVSGSALAANPHSTRKGDSTKPYSLVLSGGGGPNEISIDYDGTEYTITANGTLSAVRTCVNPSGAADALVCPSADINGFQVNAGGGNDTVTVAKSVPVPTILNGGPGLDDLIGGAGTNRINGGTGDDRLVGRKGPDQLYGGPGDDTLVGGAGKDVLRGGPGTDILRGGPGRDDERQ